MENEDKNSDVEQSSPSETPLIKGKNKILKNLPYGKMNTKILIAIAIVAGVVIVFVLGTWFGKQTYTATISYDVPAVEAAPAQEVIYETARSGKYVIGQSPSQYATGDEKEFTTSNSGTYVASEDFPAGTYDIVTVSGSGNVVTSGEEESLGLNEVMGTTNDEFNTTKYDNYTFEPNEELVVDGVSVKLVPQINDTFVIPEGTYDLIAVSGTGSVMADHLNEIMSTSGDASTIARRDNYTFETGEILEVSGVNVDVKGKIAAVEAKEAYTATEVVEYDPAEDITTCMLNDVEIDCNSLDHFEELFAEIELQISNDPTYYEY